MNKIQFIRKQLFETYSYMEEIQYEEDIYTIEKINLILNKIKEFSEICSFEELISLADNRLNVYENVGTLCLPVGYINDKKRYERHFNVLLDINNEKDYFYAFCFSIFNEPLMNIYKKINEIMPNILSKSVYNAMLVLKADSLIFEDKIDKGVIIKRITKNIDGEVVDIDYEEIDGMYENIFGKIENP
jgi:hypothetical protein